MDAVFSVGLNCSETYNSTIPYRYNEVPDFTPSRDLRVAHSTDAHDDTDSRPALHNRPVFYHRACWKDHMLYDADGEDLLAAKTPEMLDGIRFSYVPPPTVDKWRKDRIRRLLANRLPALFPDSTVRLPPEVWDRIVNQPGGDLIRLCAALCLDSASFQTRSDDTIVNMSQDIWAHYTFIDGMRYIARLTSDPPSPGEDDGRQCLRILNAAKLQKTNKTVPFYVFHDHLGVRQIVFGHDEMAVRSTLAEASAHFLWVVEFQVVPGVAPSLNLAAWSDGVKIRYISTRWEDDIRPFDKVQDQMTLLPASMLCLQPKTGPERHFFLRSPDDLDGMDGISCHMDVIPFNSPETVAYSAFWRGHFLYAMHAHSRNEDPRTLSSMYRNIERRFGDGVWTYFPVAEDERFVDFFLISPWGERTMGRTMLRTNQGRDMELGPSFPPHLPDDDQLGDDDDDLFAVQVLGLMGSETSDVQERHEATLYESCSHVCGLEPDTPSTLDFVLSNLGAWLVTFTGAASRDRETPTFSSERSFANPRQQRLRLRYGPYMHSSVSLKGAISVTPSYKRKYCSDPSSRIVLCGFMFHYPEEQKRLPQILGEYRLDKLGDPIDLYDAEALYFGFRKTRAYRKNRLDPFNGPALRPPVDFVEVSTVPQESKVKMLWWRLPLAGSVEMWHSSRHSYILSPKLQSMTPISQENDEV